MKKLIQKCLLCLLMLLLFLPSLCIGDESVSLLMINVGKGDACLLQYGDKNYLIDVGPKGQYESVLQALEIMNAEQLDAVILTHTHKDHVGAIKKLLKSGLQVQKLYYSAFYLLDEDEEHPVLDAAEKYELEALPLQDGDQLFLSEEVTLEILSPDSLDSEEENNNSLVIRLVTPYGTALLAGDIEEEQEKELLSQNRIGECDVLKVSHHGKADASSKGFVFTVRPKIAVISTDTSVDNDTASHKVISRLMEAGAEVYLTQNAKIGILVTFAEEGLQVTEVNE